MNLSSKLMKFMKDNGWVISSLSNYSYLWNERSDSCDNSCIIIPNKIENDYELLACICNAASSNLYSNSIKECCKELVDDINKQNGYLANKFHIC